MAKTMKSETRGAKKKPLTEKKIPTTIWVKGKYLHHVLTQKDKLEALYG